MSENKRITVLGGDMRLITAAGLFAENNTVFSYGWGKHSERPGIISCSKLDEALKQGEIILLGIPCSVNGTEINAPESDEKIDILYLADTLSCDTVILGGMLPEALKTRFVNAIDYNDDERFQYRNAVLTAEGALMTAIKETDFSVHGSNCFVLGSGRISKILIPMLKSFGADVCVFARKKSERAYWETQGITAKEFCLLKNELPRADILFNTVPAPVLNGEHIDAIRKESIIIDLASRPGGVDFEYAEHKGKKAIHALGLPGKTAPFSAGKIIYDTAVSLLKEKGVIL